MRFRKIIGASTAVAITGLTGVMSAEPASAVPLACGTTITTNTTLSANVGPCAGDGLVLSASNITLNLNGFGVLGNGVTPPASHNSAGISLLNVTNDTVRNGTVRGFDAGVFIFGGSGNKLSSLVIRDNINNGGGPCDLGDGVAIEDSNDNQVLSSRILHNGPYSGIATINRSGGNLVKLNQIENNNIDTACDVMNDSGVRLEGPGETNNRVEANNIIGSGVNGVIFNEYECSTPASPANSDNFVVDNNVRLSGEQGIGGPDHVPSGGVCAGFRNTITGNTSSANGMMGILITATSHDNVINFNAVNSNGDDGIELGEGATNNTLHGNRGSSNHGGHDGHDGNVNCDANVWTANIFGAVNQACVKAGNGTGVVKP